MLGGRLSECVGVRLQHYQCQQIIAEDVYRYSNFNNVEIVDCNFHITLMKKLQFSLQFRGVQGRDIYRG